MGRDKALIEWDDNVTLLDHMIRTLQLLSPALDEVLIVGDRPEYHGRGARVVADHYPETGTLGGIATALEASQNERTLIVACDMPLLSTALVRRMLIHPSDADVLVPSLAAERSDQGGRQTFETLHAIYGRACLGPIKERLAAGNLKVIGFFDAVEVEPLGEDWLRQTDPNLYSFMNVNDPGELEKAREIWTETMSN